MPTFDFTFTVRAPLSAVADLHRDTRNLQRLTPPPIRVQIQRADPLAEGSISEFTLWFGFLPLRWIARHTDVTLQNGFRDTQIQGPMQKWVHTHTFSSMDDSVTRIHEHIEYEYVKGPRGLLSRLLFTPSGLWLNFCYRRLAMRRLLENTAAPDTRIGRQPATPRE